MSDQTPQQERSYLCKKEDPNRLQPTAARVAASQAAGLEWSDDNAVLTCRLSPNANAENAQQLTLEMVPQEKDRAYLLCLADRDPFFEWVRPVETNEDSGAFLRRSQKITVSFDRAPAGVLCPVCQWKKIRVPRYRPQLAEEIAFLSQAPVIPDSKIYDESAIPEEGDPPAKSEYHDYELVGDIDASDPECVPGEQFLLEWQIKFQEKITQQVAAVKFDIPAITGGLITDILDDHTTAKKLIVEEADQGIIHVAPTDFAAYQKDSWVYFLKLNSAQGDMVDRHREYTDQTDPPANEADLTMIELVNRGRAENGLNAVSRNTTLDQAAANHADYIAADSTPFPLTYDDAHYETLPSHPLYTGYNEADRAQAVGYSGEGDVWVFENVAVEDHRGQDPAFIKWSDDAEIYNGWKGSPAHWANILQEDAVHMGLATALSSDGLVRFWVQVFGTAGAAEDIEDADIFYRALPVLFNDSKNPGLVDASGFETKDFSFTGGDLATDFELAYHLAVITDINHSSGSADIEMTYTRDTDTETETITETFTGVDIFYHCQGASNTDDGHQAFAVNDRVVVLNQAGDDDTPVSSDLLVIGHVDRLKRCTAAVLLVKMYDPENENYRYLFFDVANQDLYTIYNPETADELSQPFIMEDITVTLSALILYNGLSSMPRVEPVSFSESGVTYDSDIHEEVTIDISAGPLPSGFCDEIGRGSTGVSTNTVTTEKDWSKALSVTAGPDGFNISAQFIDRFVSVQDVYWVIVWTGQAIGGRKYCSSDVTGEDGVDQSYSSKVFVWSFPESVFVLPPDMWVTPDEETSLYRFPFLYLENTYSGSGRKPDADPNVFSVYTINSWSNLSKIKYRDWAGVTHTLFDTLFSFYEWEGIGNDHEITGELAKSNDAGVALAYERVVMATQYYDQEIHQCNGLMNVYINTDGQDEDGKWSFDDFVKLSDIDETLFALFGTSKTSYYQYTAPDLSDRPDRMGILVDDILN
ncbi:MAG: CAP domain-containing protein [Thermodesulfobacteriota bacterium]|nr:CAP domain-containing protein [Thermodesulfobacteriota bacterium]